MTYISYISGLRIKNLLENHYVELSCNSNSRFPENQKKYEAHAGNRSVSPSTVQMSDWGVGGWWMG